MMFYLYLIDFFRGLSIISVTFFMLWVFFFAFCAFGFFVVGEEKLREVFCWFKRKLWIPFILVCLCLLIPSEKTMYLMLSSKIVQNVTAHEKVSGLAEKTIKLLEQKIDEFLEKEKK